MNWRQALQCHADRDEAHVLVTLIEVRGSAPREVGAKMLVSATAAFDSIGGGELEYRAIKDSRRMLRNEAVDATGCCDVAILEINLARDAAQCCGGVVKLLLERFQPDYAPLVICGAGHVARALITIVSQLPVRMTVMDSRPEWLRRLAELTENGSGLPISDSLVSDSPMRLATCELTQPHSQIERCPQGSVFVVMTHSHDLDFELCEAILSRPEKNWCGLIASDSKAAGFRRRLSDKGFSEEELQRLVAPIGLSVVTGKQPMAVAVAVAAQLLSQPAFYAPGGLCDR